MASISQPADEFTFGHTGHMAIILGRLATLTPAFLTNLVMLILLVFSFLNKKYMSVVKIQDKETGTMVNEMGREILPADYGGDNRDCEELASFWEEELVRQEAWLSAQRGFRSAQVFIKLQDELTFLFQDR